MRNFARTHEARLLIAIVAFSLVLSIATKNFFTFENLLDLLTSYSFSGMLVAGLVVVLVAGGIDISFTAVASIAQYFAITIIIQHPGLGWMGLFAIAVALGCLCGIINALLVTTLRIASVIVTIASLNVFFGLLMVFTRGHEIDQLPDWFGNGLSWVVGYDIHQNPYIINMQMIGLVVAFLLSWMLLNQTSVGRQLRALGGNPEAAKRVGFNVLRLNMIAYGYMGAMAGLASLVQAQIVQSVIPDSLVGRELDVLAAVVLGGASLTGGIGSVLGAFLGLALLAILQNGLILLGVSSFWTQCFTGFVFIGAVAIIAWERRRQRQSKRRIVGAVA